MAKTGYKIITYLDVNPQSPSFNTTREEKVLDSECDAATSNWEVVSSYCEVDENGGNTGYYVTTEMDTNIDSPTYGQTRENKVYNVLQCQLASTDPQWAINEDKSYCETKTFPSGLEGNTGKYIVSMTDENRNSATYGQTIESALTEADWTEEFIEAFGEFPCEAVNTEPQIEPISQNCVLVECSGQTTTNGTKIVYGIDKNPYSETYLQSSSGTVIDEEACPNNCGGEPVVHEYVFTWSDGTTISKSDTISYNGGTLTYNIVSTFDGSYQDFSVSSPSVGTVTKQNGKIIFTIGSNTGSSRSVSITLTQNGSGKQLKVNITQPQKVLPTTCDYGTLDTIDYVDWNNGYYNAEKTYEFVSNCNWSIAKPSGLNNWLDIKVKPNGGEYSTTLTGTDATTYVLYMKPKLTSEPTTSYTHTITASCSCGSEKKEIELTLGAQMIGVYNNKLSDFRIDNVKFYFTDGTSYILPLNASGMGDYWTNVYKYWDASMLGKTVERAYGVYNGIEKYSLHLQYGHTLYNGGMMGMHTKALDDDVFKFEETDEDTLRQNFEASGFTEIHAFIISNYGGSMQDFTYSSDAEWFKILNVEKKTANKYYDVSTRVLENDTVEERVGTITFTQNETNKKLFIIATQKGKRCTPSTSICYQIANSAVTNTVVAATDTENTLTWDYTAVTTSINELCQETVTTESGSSSTTISFSENTGDTDKTVSGYIILDHVICGGSNIINYSFTQRGKKKYTFCYQDSSTTKALSLGWDEEQSEIQVYSYWHIDTGSTVQLDYTLEGDEPDWCDVVYTKDYIRIIPNEANTGTSIHSSSLVFVQNESGKRITLNVSQDYKDLVPSTVIRIVFSSTYSEIISIYRFRIKFSGNTSYSYITVNSGPIYQGSVSSKDITYTSQSTKNKPMISMEAEESDGTTHYVSLPGSSISGSPKLKFSSNYFRAGTTQTLTIEP